MNAVSTAKRRGDAPPAPASPPPSLAVHGFGEPCRRALQPSPARRTAGRLESWIALVICGAVLVAALLRPLVPDQPAYAAVLAPDWITLVAAALGGLTAAATLRRDLPGWLPRGLLGWTACLLLMWASGGLLLDLLRIAGLIPLALDVPGTVTRSLALAATVILARVTLFRTAQVAGDRSGQRAGPPSWFGWAACALALPYPLLKTWWALGGTLGLTGGGAGDDLAGSFVLWLPSVPFLLAAVLSLLLVSARRWVPRWMLLTAGWVATAASANVGPAACWALVAGYISGAGRPAPDGMAIWVTPLFYGSWMLFAIAIGAATWSYQVRSAAPGST